MALTQEQIDQDEFAEAEEAQAALSGYEAARSADVEDQREYRLVPVKTPCTLGILGFTLAAPKPGSKGKAAIVVKCEVNAPEAYADGSSNFSVRLSLNPIVGEGKSSSGWDMTVKNLSWLFAAVNQVSAREGKAAMVGSVLQEFPNLDPDDVPAFHQHLVDNANVELKGQTFKTKGIGIDRGQDIAGKLNDDGSQSRYPDRQSFGTLDYPRTEKK